MNTEFLKQLGIEDENPRIVLQKLGKESTDLLNKKMYLETNGDEEAIKELEELYAKIQQEKEVVAIEAQNYVEPDTKTDTRAERKEAKRKIREQSSDIYKELMKKKQEEDEKKQREVAALQQAVMDNASASQTSSTSNTPTPNANSTLNAPAINQTNAGKTTKNTSNSPQITKSSVPNSGMNMSTTKTTGDYSTGLKAYQKQDYSIAFSYLVKVAENKKPADATEEQERMQASYLLAIMYKNGLGTSVDKDRSNHYLKRAADFGFNKAQLDYGEYVLSAHNTSTPKDLKARLEGFAYVEKAANSGLIEAQKKYVDLAMNSSDTNKRIIDNAKKMIPQLKLQLDSYEAQKCDDWLSELLQTEKNAKKKASYPKKFVIGEIIFLLGTIYLFKGMNSEFFEDVVPQIGKYIINIPDILIIKWQAIKDFTEPFMTHQGIFGCWLILIGNAIRGLGSERVKSYSGSKYQTFEKVINIAIIALCIMHFIANIIEGKGFFGNGGFAQFVVMIGSILIGRLVGVILFKIIK